ncbi:MAG TPA: hypothetical protein VG389_03180 [Myxococcota bacterium]|jgi:hypothetical protein|nr:hypothetical protein [Myxococcota bacterium]
MNGRLHNVIAAVVLAGALGAMMGMAGCQCGTRIGDSCDLEPCGTLAGDEPENANFICDLQVNCDSFTCLSYRSDGMNERAPFCTADCAPDPSCDPIVDAASARSCLNAEGDPYSNCPRDFNGNPGVCFVTNQVVGPDEPTNCTVTIAGTERNSRCECVPCCEIDPQLCNNPNDCN